MSLSRLAQAHGYYRTAYSHVFRRPYPLAERVIADAIGIPPNEIWPSRYHPDGTPKKGRLTRRHKAKASCAASNDSTAAKSRHATLTTTTAS